MRRPEFSPLTIDVITLGRRAGEQRILDLDVPAPDTLRLPVIGVVPGSPLHLHVSLESVLDGIYVSGTCVAQLEGECARCLGPLSWQDQVALEELYAYEVDPEDEDPPPLVVDDTIDLEPLVRDAILLDLPLSPVCSQDCPGLCQRCGARLADEPGHRHEEIDPRWGALTALLGEDAATRPGDTSPDDRKD
jgi:uncharacterized protein